MLVKSGVDPDVGGSHLLLGELLHLLDGTGGTVLESDAMEPLVKVDGVLTGHHLKMSVHTTTFGGNPLRPKSSLVTFGIIDYVYKPENLPTLADNSRRLVFERPPQLTSIMVDFDFFSARGAIAAISCPVEEQFTHLN